MSSLEIFILPLILTQFDSRDLTPLRSVFVTFCRYANVQKMSEIVHETEKCDEILVFRDFGFFF